jgi:hypothetical protein
VGKLINTWDDHGVVSPGVDAASEELLTPVLVQAKTIESLTQCMVELERRLAQDSSNSARPRSRMRRGQSSR